MATTDKNKVTEAAHIRNIRKYNSAVRDLTDAQIDALIDQGSLQASSVLEHALAQTGGYNVVSKTGYDFDDILQSDGKISTSRLRKKNTLYSASVTSFKAKVGALRVQVWERHLDKFYYFIIPYEVHHGLSDIEIPFNRDGSPSRQATYQGINWWAYEVATFEDLAKQMIDPVRKRTQDNEARVKSLFSFKEKTGGKVKGHLSMTPNAIRKRAQRAAKREA